ncbi:IclR family transcriptional regulator [Lysinibacillus capsici]|uniref:IclR family transcriptional regulator n=1 Tax=Lysinibacillus capsici TaxID=2115968 RepID=UPI003D054AD5
MTSTYKLGLQLFRYFQVLSSSLDVVKLGESILTDLQSKTGQTVLVSLLEGENMVYIFKRESKEELKYSSSINDSQPITYGVLGKVFMAFFPEDQLEMLLKSPLPNYTPYSIVDKDTLLKQLVEIRSSKIAIDENETNLGVTGLGAPIFNVDGDAFAAIGVLGPTIQFTPEKIELTKKQLDLAAKEISAKMGFEY